MGVGGREPSGALGGWREGRVVGGEGGMRPVGGTWVGLGFITSPGVRGHCPTLPTKIHLCSSPGLQELNNLNNLPMGVDGLKS